MITRAAAAPAPALAETVIGLPRSRFTDLSSGGRRGDRARPRLAPRRGRLTLIELDLPDDLALGGGPGLELVLYESERLLTARARGQPEPSSRSRISPARIASPTFAVSREMIAGNPFPAQAYEAARWARWRLRRSYAEAPRGRDRAARSVFARCSRPRSVSTSDVGELNGRQEPLFPTVTRNTAPGTVAGVPMLTTALAGLSASGLPVGITLEGRFFGDAELLALGEEDREALAGSSGHG